MNNPIVRTIEHGSEYMKLHADGCISRPQIHMGPSGQWRVTGAVTRNNFGYITRRWTLDEIIANPGAIPWRFKNGAQRTFIQDFDHGTMREWRSPCHRVLAAV